MNFVRAETLVQEISADGKVRDIVTKRVQSKAEAEAQSKEDILRSLPEFRSDRPDNGLTLLQDQLRQNKEMVEDEEKEKKEATVRAIDEEEVEHYQHLEDAEREKVRRRQAEDREAMAAFEGEKKKMRVDPLQQSFQQSLQQQLREKQAAEAAAKAGGQAARPRVRVTVKPKQSGEDALPQPAEAGSNAGNGLGLDGYESDTSEAADT
mmetsp:Transcript_38927/g.70875  ORF Transcript_38927/g.70875 Transcript_38927/m.70875 type:complete len:208 (-) Transcript_38927:7-630(-)